VDNGVDRLRQVIEGANVRVCACGRLRGEVSSRPGIVITSLGLHDVGDESVLAVPDELLSSKERSARSIIFQSTEAHGANMDAAGANDARKLGVGENCVTALSLKACDSTKSSTVVVQELFWEVAARNCDSCACGIPRYNDLSIAKPAFRKS
jgi:hypothetical protein